MRICPNCETRTEQPVCPQDGFRTVDEARLRTDRNDPLLGVLFEGRWRVRRVLGRGGFGAVYEALDEKARRLVALKLLVAERSGNLKDIKRFQQEARAISALHHRNIVEVYDFGQSAAGQFYLSMEYLEGESLGALIERDAPLPPTRVLDLAQQIVAALAVAHRAGVVHRDLKPENLFLQREAVGGETVKLLDFGIAKVVGELAATSKITNTGEAIGSPRYMAPEQCMARQVTPRTDFYALGLILYEALLGRSPYEAKNAAGWVLAQLSHEPAEPRLAGRPVGGPLVDIILRCLKKDPAERPASAVVLMEDLEACRKVPEPVVALRVGGSAQEAMRSSTPSYELDFGTDTLQPVIGDGSRPAVLPRGGGAGYGGASGSAARRLPDAGGARRPGDTGSGARRPGDTGSGARRPPDAGSGARRLRDTGSAARAMPGGFRRDDGGTARRRAGAGRLKAIGLLAAALLAAGAGALVLGRSACQGDPEAEAREAAAKVLREGLRWTTLTGGTFRMGAEFGERDERPVHPVGLTTFDLLTTEVTVSEYQACVAAGACTAPPGLRQPGFADGCSYGLPGRGDHPANCVTWEQARGFCEYVGGRLPTEAEWEYAARQGGGDVRYPWGDEAADCTRAVMAEEGKVSGCGTAMAAAVCSRPGGHTPQGLCDMAGNAAEWTGDWYAGAYEDGPLVRNPTGPGGGTRRVIRGGSYAQPASALRTSGRAGVEPAQRLPTLGFRCARR